ncbi:hypothetical protein Ancab_006170 [Ancistrocladus abbreviatus]
MLPKLKRLKTHLRTINDSHFGDVSKKIEELSLRSEHAQIKLGQNYVEPDSILEERNARQAYLLALKANALYLQQKARVDSLEKKLLEPRTEFFKGLHDSRDGEGQL